MASPTLRETQTPHELPTLNRTGGSSGSFRLATISRIDSSVVRTATQPPRGVPSLTEPQEHPDNIALIESVLRAEEVFGREAKLISAELLTERIGLIMDIHHENIRWRSFARERILSALSEIRESLIAFGGQIHKPTVIDITSELAEELAMAAIDMNDDNTYAEREQHFH